MITASILATTHGLKPRLSSMMIGFGIPISFITLAFGTLCFVFFNFLSVMNTISTIDSKSDNAALAQKTLYSVLFSIAFAHLINDLMQSVIPAVPILKENFSLNFTQIGLITFVYQLTASLLQPFIGFIQIKTEALFLAIGMVFTISGLALLSIAVLDIGGSFTCGYWFIDISSRSVTRRF
jgi:hypothetical protein